MRAFQDGEFRALRGLDDFARLHFTALDARQNDSWRPSAARWHQQIRRRCSGSTVPSGRNRLRRGRLFRCAIASRVPMNSRWAMPMLVMIATSGCARRASGAISPGWFMPISQTPISSRCRRLEYRLRQSDVIVEIALRFCDAKAVCQNRRGEILRACFAVAAGDGDNFDA